MSVSGENTERALRDGGRLRFSLVSEQTDGLKGTQEVWVLLGPFRRADTNCECEHHESVSHFERK